MSNIRGVIDIDSAGSENFNGVFGESIAEERNSDILVQFQYNYFDEQFDVRPEVTTGDGTSSALSNLATVSSASAGTVYRTSRDSIRYRPGHTGYAYFTGMFNGTGIGKIGCANSNTGFSLKLDNGNASFGYIKDGVETGSNGSAGFDDQTIWNGSISTDDIDFTKLNIFMIVFGYLGVANPTLWIKLDTWKVVHTIKTEGVLDTTHVDTPVFPIGIYAENGMVVSSGSWSGGTVGRLNWVGSRGFTFPNTQLVDGNDAEMGECLLSGTDVSTICLFKAKELFHGKYNSVKARLTGLSFGVDVPAGNVIGTVVFQIIVGPTLSEAASYSDINSNSSMVEYDHINGTGATVDATLGVPLITKNVEYIGSNKGGSTGGLAIDAESIGAFSYSGDVFAIIAKDLDDNDVTVRVTLNWEELF